MAILKERYVELVHKDLDEVLKILHLSIGAYERILKLSIVTADTRVVELVEALGLGDRLKVQDVLHDLKGMFGNVRIEPLARLAVTMEREVQTAGVSGPLWSYFEDFSEKFKALKDVFEKEGK